METQMFRGFAQERELRRQDARGGGPSTGAGTAGQAQPAAAAEPEDGAGVQARTGAALRPPVKMFVLVPLSC